MNIWAKSNSVIIFEAGKALQGHLGNILFENHAISDHGEFLLYFE